MLKSGLVTISLDKKQPSSNIPPLQCKGSHFATYCSPSLADKRISFLRLGTRKMESQGTIAMIRLIEDNYESLKHLCEQYHVQRFEIFGSALTGEGFDPENSDLDFLVEFLPLKPGEHADAYFGLLEALQDLFHRHIDLVMPRAIKNPYFLESINKCREVIYAD